MEEEKNIAVRRSPKYPGVSINARLIKGGKGPDYLVAHVAPLVGKTIKEILVDEMNGEPVVILVFDAAGVSHAHILCDPEGNGPGWLQVQTT